MVKALIVETLRIIGNESLFLSKRVRFLSTNFTTKHIKVHFEISEKVPDKSEQMSVYVYRLFEFECFLNIESLLVLPLVVLPLSKVS